MIPLKAVFFDLDDTLCDDAAAWVSCASKAALIATQRAGIDSSKLAQEFLNISEEYWMSLAPVTETRTLITIRVAQWAEALERLTGAVDLELAHALGTDYGERRSTEIALFPDAFAIISYLRRRGVALALLTNGVRLTHVEKIAFLGLETVFDHILIADAIGFFKPHPAIFEEALRLCASSPEQTVMVGDHIDNDIGGAQSVGITAYWFNPNGAELPPNRRQPDAVIKSLGEVVGLVESRLR